MTQRRRGYSLVEMLVVMTCASTVLSLSTLLIHRSMRAHSRANVTRNDERSAWRLSAQLRRDASEASSAIVGPGAEGPSLQLATPLGEEIRYRFEASGVVRLSRGDDSREARETFEFGGVDRWVVEAFERPRRVAVACDASATPLRSGAPLSFNVTLRVPAAPRQTEPSKGEETP